MKRTIKPFAVEVRRGRKGPAAWPAISEPAPVYPKLGRSSPRPAVVTQHEEQPASPAWARARILPDLTPARRESEANDAPSLQQSELKAVEQRDERCTDPVQDRVKRQEGAAPKPRQRREKPAQATMPAAEHEQHQDEPAEVSAAVGPKKVARVRTALAPALRSAEKLARATFRRGERWKSRLPAVVIRTHVKRQQRGKPDAIAAE